MGIFDKFKVKKSAADRDQNKKADKKNRAGEAKPAEKKPVGLHSRTRTGSRRCYRHV